MTIDKGYTGQLPKSRTNNINWCRITTSLTNCSKSLKEEESEGSEGEVGFQQLPCWPQLRTLNLCSAFREEAAAVAAGELVTAVGACPSLELVELGCNGVGERHQTMLQIRAAACRAHADGLLTISFEENFSTALKNGFPGPGKRWRLDHECSICGVQFTLSTSRHHCRHCGRSCCDDHSLGRRMHEVDVGLRLFHRGAEMQADLRRVCDNCN